MVFLALSALLFVDRNDSGFFPQRWVQPGAEALLLFKDHTKWINNRTVTDLNHKNRYLVTTMGFFSIKRPDQVSTFSLLTAMSFCLLLILGRKVVPQLVFSIVEHS